MSDKIDKIILDVDGVINGTLEGVNTPFPSENVVKRLLEFQKNGGMLTLCTSKGIYPIVEIIEKFNFSGIHIADAGGIIYIVQEDKYIVDGFTIDKIMMDKLLQADEYFEIYSDKNWFIHKKFEDNKYVSRHTKLLRKAPKTYETTREIVGTKASKILFFTEDLVNSQKNTQLRQSFDEFNTKWTMSPVLQPANLMVITKKGVSKKDAVLKIAKDHSFDLSNSLGVGDHHSDWKFMSLCTYKGVMGNSTDKLKDLADQDDKACIGGVVDNDGLIDILDYFKL